MKRTGVSVILATLLIDIEVSGYTTNLSDWLHAQEDVIMKYLAAPLPETEPLLSEIEIFNERFKELIQRINERDPSIKSYSRKYVLGDGPPHILYYIDDNVFMEKYKWKFEDVDTLLNIVYQSYILWIEYCTLYASNLFWFHPNMTPPPGWDNLDGISDDNETWFSAGH